MHIEPPPSQHFSCHSFAQAATTLIVKGGADAHLPDLSAARHTPLEAAVVSGHRGLSHRLVVMVDNRLRGEQSRLANLENLGVASREVLCCVGSSRNCRRVCFEPLR